MLGESWRHVTLVLGLPGYEWKLVQRSRRKWLALPFVQELENVQMISLSIFYILYGIIYILCICVYIYHSQDHTRRSAISLWFIVFLCRMKFLSGLSFVTVLQWFALHSFPMLSGTNSHALLSQFCTAESARPQRAIFKRDSEREEVHVGIRHSHVVRGRDRDRGGGTESCRIWIFLF